MTDKPHFENKQAEEIGRAMEGRRKRSCEKGLSWGSNFALSTGNYVNILCDQRMSYTKTRTCISEFKVNFYSHIKYIKVKYTVDILDNSI